MDAFTAARELLKEDPGKKGKVAVLNLASDIYRAGNWIQTLSKMQVRFFHIYSDSSSKLMINRRRPFATPRPSMKHSSQNGILGTTPVQTQLQEDSPLLS